MATNDVVMLTVRGTVGTQQHQHTLHLREAGGATNPAALIASWIGLPRNAYRACFSADDRPVELIEAKYVCGTVPLPAPSVYNETGSNINGSRAAAAEKSPSFLAAHVRAASVWAGRRWSGGFFLGGLQDADVTLNTLQAGYLTALQAYVDALMTAYGPAAALPIYRLVVYSKTEAEEFPAKECQDVSPNIASLTINTSVTTMRSRKVGHGS